jgi:hypothetical protein
MARNKLSDLNDHLFMALERLNDEDLSIDKLELEEKRVRAIANISREIIHSSNLVYKVAVSMGKGDIDPMTLPQQLNNKMIKQ